MRNRNRLHSRMYTEGVSMTGAEILAPDPRAAAALHRLERAVAGEQVPEPVTDLDRTADWYAAHLREQIRDYLTLAAADLQARASEGIHVLPGVDERRAQEATEEARKPEEPTPDERRIMREREQADRQRQAEADLHRLDQEREERKRQREQEQVSLRAVVVAGLRSGRVSACIDGEPTDTIACPGCGKIPSGLDRVLAGYGRVLDDPSFTRPGVEHPVICSCGRAFDLVVSVRREVTV